MLAFGDLGSGDTETVLGVLSDSCVSKARHGLKGGGVGLRVDKAESWPLMVIPSGVLICNDDHLVGFLGGAESFLEPFGSFRGVARHAGLV